MDETEALKVVAFAQLARRELTGLDAKAWLDRIDSERHHLEEAFAWLLAHGRNDDAAGMAISLYDFWRLTGRTAEGRAWIDRVVRAGISNNALKADALYRNGLLAFWQGDDGAARYSHEESLRIARLLTAPTLIAVALAGIARLELRSGDLQKARLLCVEALEAVRLTDDKEGRSNAIHVLSVTAQMQGDLLEARDLMTQRMELARELGNFAGVAAEASNLSHVELSLGNLRAAKQLALEALQIAVRRGDDWSVPYDLNALAACAAGTRDFVHAAELLGAASRMVEAQGVAWPPDEAPLFEQSREAAVRALGSTAFDAAWSAGHARRVSDIVAYALSVDTRGDTVTQALSDTA